MRLWAVLSIFWVPLCGAIAMWGCSPNTLALPKPRTTPTISATPNPDVAHLELRALASFATATDTPSPAFSHDGRFLLFRSENVSLSTSSTQHRVHAFDLLLREDSVIHSVDINYQAALAPYAYGSAHAFPMGGQPYYSEYDAYIPPLPPSPTPNATYFPTLLAKGDVLLSTIVPPYLGLDPTDPIQNSTQHAGTFILPAQPNALNPSPQTSLRPFKSQGIKPRVNPQGDRVLIEAQGRIHELDHNALTLHTYPGFAPQWAPSGRAFLVHLTPYGPDSLPDQWQEAEWPPGFPAQATGEGGLALAEEGDIRLLVEQGGLPSWHPSGERFLFETPTPQGTAIASLELAGLGISLLVGRGATPVYHPSGAFFVFHDGNQLIASDGERHQPLALDEGAPQFSPCGRFLLTVAVDLSGAHLHLWQLVWPTTT